MMKKKMAMLLALVMTVTSIEGSAFAVRGADFSSEPVQITEEAEPQAGGEEISAEDFGSEESEQEESFSDEFTAEEVEEVESKTESLKEEIFSAREENVSEIEEYKTDVTDDFLAEESLYEENSEIIQDVFSSDTKLTYGNYEYLIENESAKIIKYNGSDAYIDIPSQINGYSVTAIGNEAFADCAFITHITLPESVTYLGYNFIEGTQITTITIPKKVTKVGVDRHGNYGLAYGPLTGALKLKEVIFEEGMTEIPDYMCRTIYRDDWSKDTINNIESIKMPDSIETIGECAFYGCDKITEVVLPKSLKKIEGSAYGDCDNISQVEFVYNSGTEVEIEGGAFDSCDKLKNINMTNNVKSIGNFAFADCPAIAHITLPESVTYLGYNFIEGTQITTITIPKKVTKVGVDRHGNYGLAYGPLTGALKLKEVIFEEGMTEIPDYMCRTIYRDDWSKDTINNIESIKMPDSIETIGAYSFYGCEKFDTFIIPGKVKEIGNGAFSGCTKLKVVQIPRTVTYIGTSAFSNCPDLAIYGYSGSYAETYANSNNIPFVVLDDEEIERGQGFDLTKDGHCIINDDPYFSYNSWKNWFGIFGYKIPLERYQEVYGDSYTKHIYEQNISTWKGNCFGMSATAVLFYKKKLPVTDYVHNTGILASGGYDNMASSNGRTYLKLNNDSELTKLIERYQIWQDSSEYYRSCMKDYINYGSGTDAEIFSNVVGKIKNMREPFIVKIHWWDESEGSIVGHALVVDSSRTPQDLGDGWVRIYLYDPNNPYFGSFGDKKPVLNYTQAENRFLDVNISNGQWKMAAALNGNGESITSIGYDDSGNILRNSSIVFTDVNDYPTNFNKKATLSPDKNKTNIAYASDNFEVYDESNKLVYKMEDGKVSYCDDTIVKSFIDCGYIPGMDSGISNGKLMLPRGQYRVEVETGYISYMTDNDYAGIVTKDKAVVKNTDSTSLSVSSTSSNKVNIVIEDAQSDSYTSVETDIVADKNGCEVSLEDKKLNINTENQQQIDVSVIGNGKENEIEDVTIDSTTDIDLNEEHTEHTWDSGKITKKASCTEDGEKIYTCTVCGKTNKTVIPATGHRLGAWRTTRAATALVTGIQERTCSGCDYAQTRTIAKLKPTIKLSVPQSKTLPMTLKKSFTVKVSGLAKGDSVKSWSSSNKKIVTVTSKGKLSAKKTGTVKITVTLRSGKTAWFKVKVQKSAVKTSKITGISKKVALNKGKKYTLKPVLTPVTTLDKVKYSTSNKKVATVNSRGLIVAKGAGRATITVTAGSKKAKIVVTVPKVKTTKITGVKTSLTLKRGKSYRIRAKAYPKNSDEKITYSSSNKKIATVTSKGVIKAVKKGKVTITVKSGRKSVKVKLTVK